jgi:hypothetical protein
MQEFLKKTIQFLILTALFLELVSSILLTTNIYLRIAYPGWETYNSLKKSKKKNKSKILLLGDSVGNQLFPNEENKDEINSLACNQAISLVGHFALLQNYMKAGNKVDKVILLFTPFSFGNNLDQVFTYHYFLKPFYNSDYIPMFSSTVEKQIEKIPYCNFVQVPHIKITSWSPNYNSIDEKKYTFLSPISVEYLSKIKALSIQYNFEFDIIPTPVSIEKKAIIEKMDLNEVTINNFNEEFNNYFSDIVYLESSEFKDGTHLNEPEKYSHKLRSEILKKHERTSTYTRISR